MLPLRVRVCADTGQEQGENTMTPHDANKIRTINTLRDELEAARLRRKTATGDERREITGYIRGLQVAITVVNKA